MHYGVDPKIKCLSVIMCLKVKNCQGILRCILYHYPQLIRSIFLYVADAHSYSVIHCCRLVKD